MLFYALHPHDCLSVYYSKHHIVDRDIEFYQVDRKRGWDDQIVFNALLFYVGYLAMPKVSRFPLWRTDGALATTLLHAGPVEFLYYCFHRMLHHHFLYSRYHSQHHASIITEPITCVLGSNPYTSRVPFLELAASSMICQLDQS